MARPPMKLMYLAYFIAILVPNVPSNNQNEAAIKLNMANPNGLTCSETPCAAKIKFSMFPKTNNIKNGFKSSNIKPPNYGIQTHILPENLKQILQIHR